MKPKKIKFLNINYIFRKNFATFKNNGTIKDLSESYNELVEKSILNYDRHQFKTVQSLQTFSKNFMEYHKSIETSKLTENGAFLENIKKTFESYIYNDTDNTFKGIYLHGTSGTGKTFMMDMLYKSIPISQKLRIHFNTFMLEIHSKLHRIREKKAKNDLNEKTNLIKETVDQFYKDVVLLCLDEFQVTDIVDAVILRELFTCLFNKGIILVTTSNRHPEQLYFNGLQRKDIFLPFLKVLDKHCDIISLETKTDYRTFGTRIKTTFFSPINSENLSLFNKSFEKVVKNESRRPFSLSVLNRTFEIPFSYDKVCLLSFSTLCEQPRSAADYSALAKRYEVVFLKNVRQLKRDEDDVIRRLVLLVDELYNSKALLVILSEVEIGHLLEEGEISEGREDLFAWDRCKSRLLEMQSKEYVDETVRVHDKSHRL